MYLKIILTIIALCLAIRLAVDFIPSMAQAGSVMQVDIVKVNGRVIFGGSVPVIID